MIGIEFLLVLFQTYYFTLYDVGGAVFLIAAFPFFLLSFPVSVTGFIFGVKYLMTRKFNLLSILVIISSVGAFPLVNLHYLKNLRIPLLVKVAEKKLEAKRQLEYSQFLRGQQSSYDKLTERFQTPQKVVAIDDQYSVLILADGTIVQAFRVKETEKEKAFIDWAKVNILNQEVILQLPKGEGSMNNNLGIVPCSVGIDSNVIEIRTKLGLPEKAGGFCSYIPVYIYWYGELINDRYNSYYPNELVLDREV